MFYSPILDAEFQVVYCLLLGIYHRLLIFVKISGIYDTRSYQVVKIFLLYLCIACPKYHLTYLLVALDADSTEQYKQRYLLFKRRDAYINRPSGVLIFAANILLAVVPVLALVRVFIHIKSLVKCLV